MSKIPIEQTKYYCMRPDKINEIVNEYKNHRILDYIKELWQLIAYQKEINEHDKKEAISLKHKIAWKMYDTDNVTHKVTRDGPNFSC